MHLEFSAQLIYNINRIDEQRNYYMQYYLLTLLAVILLALEFSVQKLYQKKAGVTPSAGLFFNAVNGVVTAFLFFIINGFMNGFSSFKITPFAIAMAAMMSICNFVYIIVGFNMMKRGSMALYTLFLMSGGMLIPYVVGVAFLGEFGTQSGWQIAMRIAGILVIVAGVLVSNISKEKSNNMKVILILGVVVFILNGGCSVASKIHQLPTMAELATTAAGFVMLTGIIKFVLCSVGLVAIGKKDKEQIKAVPKGQTVPLIALGAVISGVSYLCQLIGAAKLPASVLYPLITGGAIVFTTIAGRLVFKEKINKNTLLGIILCFVGTLFFL